MLLLLVLAFLCITASKRSIIAIDLLVTCIIITLTTTMSFTITITITCTSTVSIHKMIATSILLYHYIAKRVYYYVTILPYCSTDINIHLIRFTIAFLITSAMIITTAIALFGMSITITIWVAWYIWETTSVNLLRSHIRKGPSTRTACYAPRDPYRRVCPVWGNCCMKPSAPKACAACILGAPKPYRCLDPS